VDVQIHAASEALDHGHHPGPVPADTTPVRPADVEVLEHQCVDAQHRACQPVVPREAIPQPIGQREHPLAHRHPRQDRLDQPGGLRGLRRPPQLGQKPRPLHEKGTRRS
jgi:hypothetical protein